MGLYAIPKAPASEGQVLDLVAEFFKSTAPRARLTQASGNGGLPCITTSGSLFTCRLRLVPSGEDFLLRLENRLSTGPLVLFALAYLIALRGSLRFLFAIPDVRHSDPTGVVMAFSRIDFSSLLLLLAFFFVVLGLRRKSRRTDGALWQFLVSQYRVKARTIERGDGEFISDELLAWGVYALALPILLSFWRLGLAWAAILGTVLLGQNLVLYLSEVALRHDPVDRWKFSRLVEVDSLAKLACEPAVFLCLLYFSNLVLTRVAFGHDAGGDPAGQAVRVIFGQRGDPVIDVASLARATEGFVRGNQTILRLAETKLEQTPVLWAALKIAHGLLLGLGVLIALARLRQIASRVGEPRSRPDLQSGGAAALKGPPQGRSLFRLLVWAHFVAATLTVWVVTAACIDAVAYALWSRIFFFKATGVLVSWLFTPSSLLGNSVLADAVVRCLCVLLFGPLVLIAVVKISYLLCGCLTGLAQALGARRDARTQDLASELAQRLGLRAPRVVTMPHGGRRIEISQPLLSSVAVVRVGGEALSSYGEQELRAVFAHELGHSRHGLRLISILKLLAKLSPVSNNYLTLAMDTTAAEFEADRTAAALVGPDALRQAILRQAPGVFDGQQRGRQGSCLRRLKHFFDGHFSTIIVGYVHPDVIRARLAYLDGPAGGEGSLR